jgi:hypothetical protein
MLRRVYRIQFWPFLRNLRLLLLLLFFYLLDELNLLLL